MRKVDHLVSVVFVFEKDLLSGLIFGCLVQGIYQLFHSKELFNEQIKKPAYWAGFSRERKLNKNALGFEFNYRSL
jgi:hypothetical protein